MQISATNPWTGKKTVLNNVESNPQSLLTQSKAPMPLEDLLELGKLGPGMSLDTKDDWKHDGCFVGAGGQVFPATSSWKEIPPILPDNGVEPKRTVIWINGIMTDVKLHSADMQRMANAGFRVVGIHNATKGMLRDLAQCVGDKLDLEVANNEATRTAARVMAECVNEPEPPLVVGHSQGALALSNAVKRVDTKLQLQGHDPEADDFPLKRLDPSTLGGASWTFPPGPKYSHFVNVFDMVPMLAGMGPLSWLTTGPQDKVVHFAEVKAPNHLPSLEQGLSNYLARCVDRSTHGPQDIYIPELEKSG